MKLYYRAVTQDGKTIKGIVEAHDEREAANYLRKHKLIPIKIIAEDKSGLTKYLPFLKRASGNDVVFFTRQLASMVISGLTLIQALNILKNQVNNPIMSEVIAGIIADVEDGKTFSGALGKYPRVFSPLYVALVKTAESSGLLDKMLTRLADNLEKKQQLNRTIRGALMYPAIIIVMMIVVTGVMMIFVIPELNKLYENMNLELPLMTKVIVDISTFVTNYWYLVLIVLVMGFFYLKSMYHKPFGKKIIDTYTLKIPIFGKLFQQSMMAEFTRTFSLLVGSGSMVVDALHKSAEVVGNVVYYDAIKQVADRTEKGIDMSKAMEANVVFPPMVVEMVKIGEQTGKLDESLLKASEYFEREVEETVKIMTTLLEPFIMVILALGVGFLILAIITPIYNLISSIG